MLGDMGKPHRSKALLFWDMYASVIISLAILITTNLIPSFEGMYSDHLPFRWQTESLLGGHLAMSEDASGVDWDLAYGRDGTVQQVWGLGIPIFRLPFEIIARLIGFPVFPDRLCFLFALAGLIFGIIRFEREISSKSGLMSYVNSWFRLIPFILFPPFIALCGSRFLVYEEVEAYGFIFVLILAFWSLRLCYRPSYKGLIILAFCSSLAVFIRPTLGVYGIASCFIAVCFRRDQHQYKFVTLAMAGAVFLTGICLLLWTNDLRFGSPFEFGHSLNNNSITAMRYVLRFDNPYHNENIFTASKELFGLLFFTKDCPDMGDGYSMAIKFAGQSPTLRWRELYFSTYDISYFIMLIVVWAWLAWRLLVRTFQGKQAEGANQLEIISWWTVPPMLGLCIFYLRFPFMSSRYLLDFGPVFAVVTWVFWSLLYRFVNMHLQHIKNVGWLFFVLLSAWWLNEITSLRNAGVSNTWSETRVLSRMERDQSRPLHNPIPDFYTNGFNFRGLNIKFNGAGWEPTGNTKACVSLFVKDPKNLTLELASANNASIPTNAYNKIRAKIGIEYLDRKSITPILGRVRIEFYGPKNKQYQTGVQMASIATMTPEELNEGDSMFRLLKVSWNHFSAIKISQ